jgi:hypothetical protein
MHFYEFDEWEFYDLRTDPEELTNLYNNPQYAATIKTVEKELARLREHYADGSDVSVRPAEWQAKYR